jgi:hypothetical protein
MAIGKIVRAEDPIVIAHPAFNIYGPPGICKTSLAQTARDPFTFDWDAGLHRAVGRKDAVIPAHWGEGVISGEDAKALAPYKTLIADTVGRMLDKCAVDIMQHDAKAGANGSLNQKGWGVLKQRYTHWVETAKSLGKDVVMLAHEKEEKKGDDRLYRLDIQGGSYAELMKTADFVGRIYLRGGKRILDFNPSDEWIAKNPAQWEPIELPRETDPRWPTFLADLIDLGREHLNRQSEASVEAHKVQTYWREQLQAMTTAAQFNQAMPMLQAIHPPTQSTIVKQMALQIAKAKGIDFDRAAKKFTGGPSGDQSTGVGGQHGGNLAANQPPPPQAESDRQKVAEAEALTRDAEAAAQSFADMLAEGPAEVRE